MLTAEVELLAHAAETLAAVAAVYPLMLVTKGDLLDQESKLARSGLAPNFRHVEIVSGKTTATYGAVLARHGIRPERFVMVGNSLRSDILPVLELGAHAVYVPHEQTWEHEAAEQPPADRPGYHAIEHLGQLPALLARLEGGEGPR
jgi:putative hydrolase of the HAD superfamily